MKVRILGPFRLEDGGQQVTISGVRQRAVLARLLLQANEVVPSEQLLVDLWGEDSPQSPLCQTRVRHGDPGDDARGGCDRSCRGSLESGIVTDVETPGTYRVSDGSRVEFPAAVAAWIAAALPVLERVARIYHATITYKELGDEVQQAAGIHTRVLLMNWIGQVLGGVSQVSHRRGQPMLSALCVHSDGTVGVGYSQAIMENYGSPLPDDLDMHAAEERLRCYQHFGPISLPVGERPPSHLRLRHGARGSPARLKKTLPISRAARPAT